MKNNNLTPNISVIMSVYNGEKYLKDAIESILNQTYTDFEFIITNDNSKDNSQDILEEYAKKDNRIKLFTSKKYHGMVTCLNNMLSISKGKYIARMDADDISLPERLKKQIEFLENNPNISVCGAWYVNITVEGNKINTVRFYETNDELFNNFVLSVPVANPLSMMNKSFLLKHQIKYKTEFIFCEDYKLWLDIFDRGGKFYNLQETLLYYRNHDHQLSKSKKELQDSLSRKISREYVEKIFQELKITDKLPKMFYFSHLRWINKIKRQALTNNKTLHIYPRKQLRIIFNNIKLTIYISIYKKSVFVPIYFLLSFDFIQLGWKKLKIIILNHLNTKYKNTRL